MIATATSGTCGPYFGNYDTTTWHNLYDNYLTITPSCSCQEERATHRGYETPFEQAVRENRERMKDLILVYRLNQRREKSTHLPVEFNSVKPILDKRLFSKSGYLPKNVRRKKKNV